MPLRNRDSLRLGFPQGAGPLSISIHMLGKWQIPSKVVVLTDNLGRKQSRQGSGAASAPGRILKSGKMAIGHAGHKL